MYHVMNKLYLTVNYVVKKLLNVLNVKKVSMLQNLKKVTLLVNNHVLQLLILLYQVRRKNVVF